MHIFQMKVCTFVIVTCSVKHGSARQCMYRHVLHRIDESMNPQFLQQKQ